MPPRLLLLLPSTAYQAGAFLDAARRIGADLTVGVDHASVFGTEHPDNLLRLDFADAEGLVREVRAFARSRPLAAVFGVDDDTAVAAARAAGALGLPHAPVPSCEAARDKHRQRVLMLGAGVRVPPFTLRRFEDDLAAVQRETSFPCVVKPTRLSMSRGVMRADDAEELAAAVQRLRAIVTPLGLAAHGYLVEAFVPGAEVALEGFLADRRLTVLAVFDKPDPLDGPFFAETIYVTPTRQSPAEHGRIAALVESGARAIGLNTGPVHAEVRLARDGPVLIELAARPIGGKCGAVLRFGPSGGVSLEEVLLRGAMTGWESGKVGTWKREDRAAAVYMMPVPRAGTLRGVTGVDEARAARNIEDVVITAHVGQQLLPLPEGNTYLGFIFARAGTAADAEAAVRAAHARLRFALA